MCKLSNHAKERCHEYGINPRDVEKQTVGLEEFAFAVAKEIKVTCNRRGHKLAIVRDHGVVVTVVYMLRTPTPQNCNVDQVIL